MNEPIVDLQGVSRSYGRVQAVNNLSLKIGPGISYGLIGRNGSGKTTTLRLIMGMLRPERGQVRLFGGDPVSQAESTKLHVGFVAEDQAFPPSLRPPDLFRFFRDCHPTWDSGFADSLVHRFKIPLDRSLERLSKGEQRQVALVCAVAHRPKLLVLDEPGGGLDPFVRRGFLEEVVDLLAGQETTVLFSSHHLQEVERLATRVGILHEGMMLLEEDLDHLKEKTCRILVEAEERDPEQIRSVLPGCVRISRREGSWVLTMLCTENEARDRVATHLGGQVRESHPLTLEDLFISLVE